MKFIDLTGFSFGRLTVVRKDGIKIRTRWICKCVCGKEKSIAANKLRNGNTLSCGCLNKELSINRMIENNPISRMKHPLLGRTGKLSHNYGRRKLNPKTPDRIRERGVYDVAAWRVMVFNRDNFTCVKCGVRGSEINAHHIVSWHADKTLRIDVNNGATLCNPCHRMFHKIYTNFNNNRIQFDLFVNDGTI